MFCCILTIFFLMYFLIIMFDNSGGNATDLIQRVGNHIQKISQNGWYLVKLYYKLNHKTFCQFYVYFKTITQSSINTTLNYGNRTIKKVIIYTIQCEFLMILLLRNVFWNIIFSLCMIVLVTQLERLVKQIGTAHDSEEVRDRV